MPQTVELSIEELIKSSGVTRETLDATPKRAVQMLDAIAKNRGIRREFVLRGYDTAAQQRAINLIATICTTPEVDVPEVTNNAMAVSVNFVDSRDDEVFAVIDAAWEYNYPEQYAYATKNIGPASGIQSVVNTGVLLKRLDTMYSGAEREATRKQDREALQLLARRGVAPSLRDELAKHVKIVDELQQDEPLPDTSAYELRRVEALVELRKWFVEWSGIARVAIKRRDYLISLGLASRRRSSSSDDNDGVDLRDIED